MTLLGSRVLDLESRLHCEVLHTSDVSRLLSISSPGVSLCGISVFSVVSLNHIKLKYSIENG